MANRFMATLWRFILFSAIIHILVLFWLLITSGDFSYFNYFKILQLDLFFPQLVSSPLSQLASIAAMVIVYLFLFFLWPKTKK